MARGRASGFCDVHDSQAGFVFESQGTPPADPSLPDSRSLFCSKAEDFKTALTVAIGAPETGTHANHTHWICHFENC